MRAHLVRERFNKSVPKSPDAVFERLASDLEKDIAGIVPLTTKNRLTPNTGGIIAQGVPLAVASVRVAGMSESPRLPSCAGLIILLGPATLLG